MEVAPCNHHGAVPDEIADDITQRCVLPLFCCDPIGAEQYLRDLALAGLVLASVGHAQHCLETPSLLGGHPLIGRNAVAEKMAQKAVERSQTVQPVAVKRDNGS